MQRSPNQPQHGEHENQAAERSMVEQHRVVLGGVLRKGLHAQTTGNIDEIQQRNQPMHRDRNFGIGR